MIMAKRLNLHTEKKIPIINFLTEFLAGIELIGKKQNSREKHVEEMLIELEKDLSNFQISMQKRQDSTRIH